jgi:hypothetical protein
LDIDVFHIAQSESGEWWFLSPISVENSGKYLVRLRSKTEAENTRARLCARDSTRLAPPDRDDTKYTKVDEITGTPIYELR